MADYAPNYTARLKVKYRAGLREHSITLRGKDNGTPEEFVTAMRGTLAGILTTLQTHLFNDFQILSMRRAARSSDVFLPVTFAPITLTPGGGVPTLGDAPQFISMQGITPLGNRASMILFGLTWSGDNVTGSFHDYRSTAIENVTVANLINVLNNDENLIAIDRTVPIWYPYVNLGYHAHYQRKGRA